MRSVRVSKIAGAKHLVRPDLSQQLYRQFHVFLTHWLFFYRACFIEREIHEMRAFITNPHITAGCLCFASPDQTFDRSYLLRVYLVAPFFLQVFASLL